MAGTRHQLQLTVSATVLRTLLLSSSMAALLLPWETNPSRAQEDTPSAIRTQAQTLTQQGHQQLDNGQAYAALNSWLKATELYREAQFPEGVMGSLINQSLAQQELGHQINACRTLLEALEMERWVCDSARINQELPENPEELLRKALQQQPNESVVVLAQQNLGDVLRQLGKPIESKVVLNEAISRATRLSLPQTNSVRLSLANTERSLYERSKELSQTTDEPLPNATAVINAQAQYRETNKLYQKIGAARGNGQADVTLQAQLNQFSLLLDFHEWVNSEGKGNPALQALAQETKPLIRPLVKEILTADFSQLPAQASIYARLSFADSLIAFSQETGDPFIQPLPLALEHAQAALRRAEQIGNGRAKSAALGTIGNIYTQNNQLAIAQQQLEAALAQAQTVNAWDLSYQWQAALGGIYERLGQRELATEAFGGAVDSLERVRANLIAVDTDLQFSFREKVEPIYRDYMRLLLASPTPNLEQVIRTNEQLQIAELENFLQCGKLEQILLSEVNQIPNVAIIHVLNLGDQYEVVVRSPDGSTHRHTPEAAVVKTNADNLLLNLQDRQFAATAEEDFLANSQALYQQFIAPIKPYLPPSGTLVFVLDSVFQTLPMAMLHNGQSYLLQNYNVANTLGSQLRQPKALGSRKLRALIAGLSEKSPSFQDPNAPKNLTPLPEVEREIVSVEKNTRSTVLLNEGFTRDRLEQKINSSTFPVLHLTTHGQFSSDPEQTVLLAWNQAINVRDLDRLLRSNGNPNSIELLVLSACQTAKGDERSALGIAGVAAQAGARSTLASLWLVDANATATLMEVFYQGLRQGLPKAEALRQAQLSLLVKPQFSHPAYWAGFILIGSWL